MKKMIASIITFKKIEPKLRKEVQNKGWLKKFIMLGRWLLWRKAYRGTHRVFLVKKSQYALMFSVSLMKRIEGTKKNQEVYLNSYYGTMKTPCFLNRNGFVRKNNCGIIGEYRETNEYVFIFITR